MAEEKTWSKTPATWPVNIITFGDQQRDESPNDVQLAGVWAPQNGIKAQFIIMYTAGKMDVT